MLPRDGIDARRPRDTVADIAGTGAANPTATILSASMMLDHLRFTDDARAVDGAISAVYESGRTLTPDEGGDASTIEFAAAVIAEFA